MRTRIRLRAGAYFDAELWDAMRPDERHLIEVVAAGRSARSKPVFSHESAAVVWGFPIVDGLPHRPQIVVPPGSGLRSTAAVIRREAPLRPLDVVSLGEIRVTDVERTLVDFASSRSFLSGVCATEFVLASRLTTVELLGAALARRRPLRGSRKVEAVVAFSGARSGSALESLCRVRLEQLGFPQPEQQREFRGARGEQYFVDFYWPEFDVICELDGKVKYEHARFLAGRTPQQALWDEKAREDELRAQCTGFVRLTWDDAWNRAGLVAKLSRAGIPRLR